MRKLYLLFFLVLLCVHSQAQNPAMLKDVYPGNPASSIQEIVPTSNLVFFNALDGSSPDRGLFRTDGTSEGTVKLNLTYPGYVSTKAEKLTALGNKVVFAGDNKNFYGEVWVSDGTQAGTLALERFQPTSYSTNANRRVVMDMARLNNDVLYGVKASDNHLQLKKTNGQPGEMVVVKDFGTYTNTNAQLALFKEVNGILYFVLYDGAAVDQLWRSDGTTAGTYLVKDFTSSRYVASYLMPAGNQFFIMLIEPGVGDVLWKSNGTPEGTVAVKTIDNTFTRFNFYPQFAAIGSTLYFTGFDQANGTELWKSDGTTAGTLMAANVNPGAASSNPSSLTVFNNAVFFAAESATAGRELFQYGSFLSIVKDISPGTANSWVKNLVVSNNTLLFTADNGLAGAELWITNGTNQNTRQVADINPGSGSANPSVMTASGNNVFFAADNGVNGSEIFKYNNSGGITTGVTYETIYVNDNSTVGDIYTTAVGNDANPGTPEAPVATIGKAVSLAQTGYTILVDAGVFTEQVTIDKGLVLKGAGSALTTVELPSSPLVPAPGFPEYGVMQTAGDIADVIIQDFTLDGKNLGAAGPVWGVMSQTGGQVFRCEIKNMANNGVFVRYTGTAPRSVNVSNNYIHHFNYVGINLQGANLSGFSNNNKIDGTGGPFVMGYIIGGDVGPLVNAIIFNNEIPFYNGWGIKVNSVNATVTRNSLTGAMPAIQYEGPGLLNATCNWYGTTDQTVIAGKVTGNVSFGPWLIDGSDTDPASVGFQPVLSACVGNNTEFYVNDNSQAGDRFTTAVGNDNNPGTKEAPFATLIKANSVAPIGSTIYVDAGNFDFGNTGYPFTKALTFRGANYDKSPNSNADKKVYNSDRNAESHLVNFTAIINSNYLSFEGFSFDVGNRNAVLLSNSSTTANDFGNVAFRKNVFKISSTLPQFSITGKFVTSPAMPVTSGYVVEDNRFEKRDTIAGTTLSFSYIKNISVDNNAFVVTGPKFRTQTAMSFGNTGIVDAVSVTSNMIDQPSTAVNGPRISQATIAGNTIDNSATVLGVGSAMAEGSAIIFSNNMLTNTTGGTPFILYTRSGTSLAGTANSLLIENNTMNGILPVGSVNQLAAFLNYTVNNSVLNPSVVVRGNKINYSGDFSQSQSFSNRPLTVRGNIRNVSISNNEIEYSGGAMLPYTASTVPENPAITVNTDWSSSAFMPDNAVISITNNRIKGFKQSVIFHDPTSAGKDTYTGYGNIYFGASVNVNNNSFTDDVISINNGTDGAAAAVNASCNWFGTASNVASKVTAEVNVTPWLVSGTDASTDAGFQPLDNVCVGPQTEFYVNDNSTNGDVFTTGIGNNNNPGTKELPFATLAKAVSVAAAGNTIFVDAGTYVENIVVDKSLVLKGAKAGSAPGTELARGAESVLLPAVNNINDGNILTIAANGVTIDGFTFDGDNPSLSGGNNLHGVDVNVARAIANGSVPGGWTAINDLVVQNNIFKNINRNAVHLNSASFTVLTGNVIDNNRMDNICSWATGRSILLERNAYASVTNNKITRSVVGIQTSLFNTAALSPVSISNNLVEALLYGVYFLDNSGSAGAFTVADNTINKYLFSSYAAKGKPAAEFNNSGLALLRNSGSMVLTIHDNVVDGFAIGVLATQNTFTDPVVLSGGTIQNSGIYGVQLTNFFSGIAAGNSKLVLKDVGFTNNATGIYVYDNSANSAQSNLELSLTGSTYLTGGQNGIIVYGNRTAITGNMVSVPFSGQSARYIHLYAGALGGQQINASGSTFDGVAPADMSLTQLFGVEDKIVHSIDAADLGFVRVKAGEVFTTPGSFFAPATKVSVQRAVNAATAGDLVHLAAGEYPGQVLVDKGLGLKGAGIGQTIISFDADASLSLAPGQTWNAGILQTPAGIGDVFIDNITIDGKNGSLSTNNSFPLAGIILQTGGAVRNSEIKNMKLQSSFSPEGNGIYVLYNGTEPRTVTVTGNVIRDIHWVGLNVTGANLTANIQNNEIDVSASSFGMAANVGGWGGTIASADFRNNQLKGFSGFGLQINATTATVSQNSLEGTAKAIINEGAAIDAQCNWLASAGAVTIAGTLSGAINYTPWLTNGTDNDATATGFQPLSGSCNGTPPIVTIGSQTNVLCKNGNTGAIDLTVTGGGAPYTYAWTKEESMYTSSNEDPSELRAGIYHLLLTDAYGSTATAEVTISEPAMVLTASATGTNVLCFGGATGAASVAAEGGTAPYTYLWSNGATTAAISDVPAGTYSVTVTDANGCTATANYTVTEPTLLSATVTGTSTACANYASVQESGGTAGYTYLWSNGATTAAISDVPAGTYSVTVTDANGCTATASIVLNRQAFNPSVTVTNVSCFGGQNGSLTVTGSNGVAPFQYSINGSALQTSNTFTGLSAGSYTIRVVDANGCNGFATKVITEPAAIVLTESSVTATCSDQSTGTITYNVSGGAGAVTFTWTGPNGFTSTKQNLTEVGTGTYQVTATDKNGCTVTATSFVPALPLITVTTRVTNVSCRGEANGAISLAVSGGAGNGFIFSWNNGATSNEIAGLVAGNYTVTIQDAATGCSLVQSYTITQPSSLVSMTTTRTNVTGCATLGAITVTGTGGTAPYQYRLNNGSYQPSSTFSDLQAGDYTVWTRDANGCTTSRLVTITDNGTDAYENNNSKNAAKIIAVGESINARIALANDAADWFQFTTPAGSRLYTVSLTHPSVTYAVDVYPSAKNAAALVPVSTSNGIRQYALAGNSTYYISITGDLSFTCYTLSVSPPSFVTGIMNSSQETTRAADTQTGKLHAEAYPIPHNGAFTIRVFSPEEGLATVELFTVGGQKLAEKRGMVRTGIATFFSFSGMPQGAFFYRVLVGSRQTNGKVLGAK